MRTTSSTLVCFHTDSEESLLAAKRALRGLPRAQFVRRVTPWEEIIDIARGEEVVERHVWRKPESDFLGSLDARRICIEKLALYQ